MGREKSEKAAIVQTPLCESYETVGWDGKQVYGWVGSTTRGVNKERDCIYKQEKIHSWRSWYPLGGRQGSEVWGVGKGPTGIVQIILLRFFAPIPQCILDRPEVPPPGS